MKEVKLSDGRIAKIKEGKGKDLFFAHQMANTPTEILKLLLTRLVEIDKKNITEEELDEMPIHDLMILMREVTETIPFSEKKPS